MNKTAIKNYAIWAREQLIESAKQRAFEYELTETGENNAGLDSVGGRLLTATERDQRKQLIEQIRQKGYSQVMEEAAYTWFNRFIALRFMEVNGYLPSKVRVFTDETGAFKPEILKQAMTVEMEGLDRTHVLDLLDRQNNEELFKYLIITQCNALSDGLPYVFEKVANWTELLFPDNLLRSDSVIGRMISDIDVEDWSDEVEIIGWMYQYYISEKHDEVVDPLHGKVCKKEDIPAATQLFTTDWVVRYILDNSLGRYWIERHPESKLAEMLEFFVTPKDGEIPTVNESIVPEELKILDPCVGSGHFLSYAFDVLLEIYRESGWADRDAAKSILERNLYGLDIDDRASQLACFAVMMKARKYNRRIISADTTLHIMAMQDSTGVSDELIHYAAGRDTAIKNDLNELRILFNNAKEYGSTINVPKLDFSSIYARFNEIANDYSNTLTEAVYKNGVVDLLLPLVRQAEILSEKYDVVATNPPYLNKYSPRLKAFISEHYEAFKGDLFSVFIYRNFDFCKPNGYSGFMTPMVWMFIKTYEELRKYIITQKSFATLIQFEYSAFEEATVPICSFVLKNGKETTKGLYFKLSDFRGGMQVQKEKVLEALANRDCGYYYEADESNFSKIPGSPVAYWLSKEATDAFVNCVCLGESEIVRGGLTTGDNNRFLRMWFEISRCTMSTSIESMDDVKASSCTWFPLVKGGEYRKWYGNLEYVVNWKNDGEDIKWWVTHNPKDPNTTSWSRRLFNTECYFKRIITWSGISSGKPSMRIAEKAIFGSGAKAIVESSHEQFILAFLNSSVALMYLTVLSPTLNYESGHIASLPLKKSNDVRINQLANNCINISQKDWDAFETSWDFKKHPLI